MIVKSELIVRETTNGPWFKNHEVHLQLGSTYRLLAVCPSQRFANMFIEAYRATFTKELAALTDINDPRLLDAALDFLQKG